MSETRLEKDILPQVCFGNAAPREFGVVVMANGRIEERHDDFLRLSKQFGVCTTQTEADDARQAER